MIAAVHIDSINNSAVPTGEESLNQYFEEHRLIGSNVSSGKTSIWSALRLHKDNFNRILLLNNSVTHGHNGLIIRTLLELEAYRNMMLLAFPLSQSVASNVSSMEKKLATLLTEMTDNTASNSGESQLKKLSKMTSSIAQLIATSRYRFDAAHAYNQIVQSRLSELDEHPIEEVQTFSAFIKRRLSPAYRTIQATKYRLDDLAIRTDRASDFLRTKIDMIIEVQNQALLKSMDRRAQMQFSLQQTVEGLSVVVVTYYLLALTQYLLNAVSTLGLDINNDQIIALMIPVYLTCVWFFTLRVKKRLKKI